MNIEELKMDDIKSLKNLYEICMNIKCDVDIMAKKYKDIIGNNNSKQFVLKHNKIVVGHVKYDIINDIFDMGKPYMYISDLCIHPDYRKKGYSKLLMNYCEICAKKLNCKYIFLNSSDFRTVAKQLYLKLGYVIRDSKIYKKVI